MDMLAELFGEGPARLIAWGAGILILIILLLLALRLLRGAIPGTFISGGKNRKHRLAVVDATAIDSARRLVLVRCDGTEHLLLIGGANDLVVERSIGMAHTGVFGDAQTTEEQTGQPFGGGGGGGIPVAADLPATMAEPEPAPPAPQPPVILPHPSAASRQANPEDARISAIASAVQRQAARPPVSVAEQAPAPVTAPVPTPARPAETPVNRWADPAPLVEPRPAPAVQPEPVTPVAPSPAAPERPQTTERPATPQPYQRPLAGPAAIAAGTLATRPAPAPAAPLATTEKPVLDEFEDDSLNASLLRELEETLAPVKQAAQPAPRPAEPAPAPERAKPQLETPEDLSNMSLEDEMSRLLADITRDGDGKA